MVRRYEEPIEVRSQPVTSWQRDCSGADEPFGPDESSGRDDSAGRAGSAGPDATSGAPTAFIWRGRLYAVRDVLGHWHERRAWWREALDLERTERSTRPSGRLQHLGRNTSITLTAPEQLEQEVWRVSASPGRMHSIGVYDLGHDHEWRLLRVAD